MLQLILIIIAVSIIITIVKKVGGFAIKLVKTLFELCFGLIYFAIAGPAMLCSKIFDSITKALHLQCFAYYLLSLFSIPSFIYLCAMHIPYSKKEKFINCDSFFEEKKKQRHNTIAMSCFLTLEGIFFLMEPTLRYSETGLFLGGIFIIGAFIYALVKISKWKKENAIMYEYYTE